MDPDLRQSAPERVPGKTFSVSSALRRLTNGREAGGGDDAMLPSPDSQPRFRTSIADCSSLRTGRGGKLVMWRRRAQRAAQSGHVRSPVAGRGLLDRQGLRANLREGEE